MTDEEQSMIAETKAQSTRERLLTEDNFTVSKKNIALMLQYVNDKNREALKAKYGRLKYRLYRLFARKRLRAIYSAETLLEGTGYTLDDFKRRLTDSVSVTLEHTVYDRAKRMLRDQDAVLKASSQAVGTASVGEIFTILKILGPSFLTNPHRLIEAAKELNALYTPNSEARAALVGQREILVTFDFSSAIRPHLTLDDCRLQQGSIAGILLLVVGFPKATVSQSRCTILPEKVGWVNGTLYEVTDDGNVMAYESDRAGHKLSPGRLIGALNPDGSFPIGDTLYGADRCVFHATWEGKPSIPKRLYRATLGQVVAFFDTYRRLVSAHSELREYAETLEEMVEKRTLQYREQREKAEAALVELQAAQEQLVKEEKSRRIYQVRAAQADAVARFLHQTSNLVLQPLASTMIVFEDLMEIADDCRSEWGPAHQGEGLLQELDEGLSRVMETYPTASRVVEGYRELFHAFYEIYVSTKPERDVNQDLRFIESLVLNKYILTQVELELVLDPAVPPIELAGGMQSIFIELLQNAARHGSKKLLVQTVYQGESGGVQVRFYNDGQPIPEDQWEAVLSGGVTSEGRGFGLADAHYIIETLNRGQLTLSCSDREDYAVLFVIDLPIS